MSQQLPDTQAAQPEVSIGLNRVGIGDVEKLIEIDRRNKRPLVLMATFRAFVDLPRWRKGADMSRNMEVVDEILEDAVTKTSLRIEDICGDAAERLLQKHEYTTKAEVSMEAEFAIRERTPTTDRPTQGTATVIAGASATEEVTREELGARVTGMTVCPCSQGMMRARAKAKLKELGVNEDSIREFLDEIPQAGHSQRGHATLTIESRDSPSVDVEEIIDIARESMSTRIYNLAKRPDEDHMTYHAHVNAKFVEDCVRSMAQGVVQRFPDLNDDTVITMKQSNDESIHQHNAYAERVSELGALREEFSFSGSIDEW